MRRKLLTFIFCAISTLSFSQDSAFIKVHFLYGSKPVRKYKESERKWFGGTMGGHVGIEGRTDSILNFLHRGKFHVFAKMNDKHGLYKEHSVNSFYSIFGSNPDSVKMAVVYVPVTMQQKQKFDSLSAAYLKNSPYDYALFGMRCGAATYEILGQLAILPAYSYQKTYKKIFYPKKLRKRLFKEAAANGWTIEKHNGSFTRKWEKD